MASHKFTVVLQLVASAPVAENKAATRWSVQNKPGHQAEITFFAPDPPAALIRLHFVAQRLMRGAKQPNTKGVRRYLPTDYTVVSMRSENGSYDLPRSAANPNLSSPEARRATLAREAERITPRDRAFAFVPFPVSNT